MKANLAEKIAFLNRLCGKTLSITHYTQWAITSYGNHSLFCCKNGDVGSVHAPGLEECVDKALKLVKEEGVSDA